MKNSVTKKCGNLEKKIQVPKEFLPIYSHFLVTHLKYTLFLISSSCTFLQAS